MRESRLLSGTTTPGNRGVNMAQTNTLLFAQLDGTSCLRLRFISGLSLSGESAILPEGWFVPFGRRVKMVT